MPGRVIARSRSSGGYFLGAGIVIILSGNQTLHETRGDSLSVQPGQPIAVETIYQALYAPSRVIARDASAVLRSGRPHRRPRRRGDRRRPRYIVPITPINQRPIEVLERLEPGHWKGDCIVGAYNRSAIGTLVARTLRYTILLHLDGESRAGAVRDQLIATFRRSRRRCGSR